MIVINEAYNAFKDMKKTPNGKYTDGWGNRYDINSERSNRIHYKDLDYQYDYKKGVLDVYRGVTKIEDHFLSVGDWLDGPEYHIENFYQKDKNI